MDLGNLISLAGIKNTVSVGGFLFMIIASLLQISKIEINPWDSILGWFGDKLNTKTNKRLEEMEKEIGNLRTSLAEHIANSEEKELQDIRRDILDFANACMVGHRHTKEQFDFIINECDDYEAYIEEKKIKNGVITSAIKEIRRLNDKCIRENSFLKEREYN